MNNTLKRIAEGALAVATASGRPLGRAGRTLAGAGGDYVKGVGAGLRKAAKREGPKDGEKAFKWLRRIVITIAVGGGVVQAGAFTQLAQLMAKYPNAFEWLERILHYMK